MGRGRRRLRAMQSAQAATQPRWRDPLFVCSWHPCVDCNNERRRRKSCERCRGGGCEPIDLSGLWWPRPGFLVCGGPSLKAMPYHRLAERGVVSLAVNNVAGFAPVRAWCFSDPQEKFHHGLFCDPAVMTFAPHAKLNKAVRAKLPDSTFRFLSVSVRECPNSYGFARRTTFNAETFLTDWFAHWGYGGKAGVDRPFSRLATMLCGLRLMHYLGCPRVYLLGVDLDKESQEPGKAYCFDERGSGGGRHLLKENRYAHLLRPVFDAAGWQVFNCNAKSKMDAFEYRSFDEALADCKGPVPDEPFTMRDYYVKSIAKASRADSRKNGAMTLEELTRAVRMGVAAKNIATGLLDEART